MERRQAETIIDFILGKEILDGMYDTNVGLIHAIYTLIL
jgi:hypothetical protein